MRCQTSRSLKVCRLIEGPGTRGHGFIAQRVEPILPDVVQTDDETGIKSINYVGMIGHLVEAIKEQQTQIDALTAQVEELKRQ